MAGLSISLSVSIDKIPNVTIDEGLLAAWLQERLDDARNHFISSCGASPSAPGDFPGVRTGALVGSISVEASGRSGSISAGVAYAGYLASGTRKMAKRKMLAEALDESLSANPQAEQLAQAVRFE